MKTRILESCLGGAGCRDTTGLGAGGGPSTVTGAGVWLTSTETEGGAEEAGGAESGSGAAAAPAGAGFAVGELVTIGGGLRATVGAGSLTAGGGWKAVTAAGGGFSSGATAAADGEGVGTGAVAALTDGEPAGRAGAVWAGTARCGAVATTGVSPLRSRSTVPIATATSRTAKAASPTNMRSKPTGWGRRGAARTWPGPASAGAGEGVDAACGVCNFWAFFRASLIRLMRE
jgi:hypothetical protein